MTTQEHQDQFIPYACHYSPSTLLSKNGELIQIIKIVGFTYQNVGSEEVDLRNTVRKAIFDCIDTDKYSFWFHTIRRKQNLATEKGYPVGFSDYLNRKWNDRYNWKNQFINELFITIVKEGGDYTISNPASFLRAIYAPSEIKFRQNYIKNSYEELDETVSKMMETLSTYGARRLEVVTKNGKEYSQLLQFLNKVLNLTRIDTPVLEKDISQTLASHKITFGSNVLEIAGSTGKRYGSILTIKEYKERTADLLDEFLQLPQPLVISQLVTFTNRKDVISKYKFQEYILGLSGDERLAQISGISEIMAEDNNKITDYGQNQLTILVSADNLTELEENVYRATITLRDLGIVFVREDIRMEDCFWAQLPSNFAFAKRLKPINISRVAGFASLYNFPAGQAIGNKWGNAITVFHTAMGTPYFFNFHHGDSGHTAIIGPRGSGKTVLLNFLVSQAQKMGGRLFYFDCMVVSQIFIKAIGGQVYDFTTNTCLNPFRLEDNTANRGFLRNFLQSLITSCGEMVSEDDLEVIKQAVEHNYTLPEKKRKLSNIAAFLKENSNLDEKIKWWYGDGMYARLFDNEEDTLDLSPEIAHGFEMEKIIEAGEPVFPTVLYLLHRIGQKLDGTKTMIVMDEAWELMDNVLFAPLINNWLNYLTANNAVAILATSSIDDATDSIITSDLLSLIPTQLYLPNSEPTLSYVDVFGLSDEEFNFLRRMKLKYHQFLLKQGDTSVVATLNLNGMNDLISVLSNNKRGVRLMEEAIEIAGDKPNKWLPQFFNKYLSQLQEAMQ